MKTVPEKITDILRRFGFPQITIALPLFIYTFIVYHSLFSLDGDLDAYGIFRIMIRCVVFSLVPVVWLWKESFLSDFFKKIGENKLLVICGEGEVLSEEDWDVIDKPTTRRLHWLSLFFSGLSTTLFIQSVLNENSMWSKANHFLKFFSVPVNFMLIYMSFTIVVKLILNVNNMQTVLKSKAVLMKVFDLGQYGRWRCLSQYSFRVAISIAVVGGMLVFSEYGVISQNPNYHQNLISSLFPRYFSPIYFLHLLLIIYFYLSIFVVRQPIQIIQEKILESRQKFLDQLESTFKKNHQDILSLLNQQTGAAEVTEVEQKTKELKQLELLYERISNSQRWPLTLDLRALEVYILSAPVSTILTFIVDVLIQKM